MTEQEPDLSPSSDRLFGTADSALPAPNRGEPELVVTASPDAALTRQRSG